MCDQGGSYFSHMSAKTQYIEIWLSVRRSKPVIRVLRKRLVMKKLLSLRIVFVVTLVVMAIILSGPATAKDNTKVRKRSVIATVPDGYHCVHVTYKGEYKDGEISYDAALASADSANDLRLLIKLGGGEINVGSASAGLSLQSDDEDLKVGR